MWHSGRVPAFPPLSARSTVLSLVLGSGHEGLTSAQLAAAARHLSINPATVRVALTRAVAAGELLRDGAHYRLGGRLLDRGQRHAVHADVIDWDGSWEMAVVVATGRTGAERSALRARLSTVRLGELREGVWMRPANLRRDTAELASVDVRLLTASPHGDPTRLAADLWDLDGWATETVDVLAALDDTSDPGPRLAVAAHLVRHLSTDPLLPDELQPDAWPAAEAHRAYDRYLAELQSVVTA